MVVRLRPRGARSTRWQVVHGAVALLLVAGVAVREAPWLVHLELLAALPPAALALAPAGTWPRVLAALPCLLAQAPPAGAWLARGLLVLVGAVAVLATTAADPDAAIARSGVARGEGADTAYLSVLSADAVPALLALEPPQRACALAHSRLQHRDGWTSWNLSRTRAARLLAGEPAQEALACPVPWP